MKRSIAWVLCLVICLLGTISCSVPDKDKQTDTADQSVTAPSTESLTDPSTEPVTEPETVPMQDASHASTPLMGWASWNLYRTNITEEKILAAGKALTSLGLDQLGYTYVNIDDGFQQGRDENGVLVTHPVRFPNGMKSVADALHAMGLYAGIYTDAGSLTCGFISDGETANDDVGLYGHEEQDLSMYFDDWGYDFIKVDWCGGRSLNLSRREQYTKIGTLIQQLENKLGRNLLFNICCWEFPGAWAAEVADSWRTGGDIGPNFASILYQIDQCKKLSTYQSAGHINDPDMLEIGMGMTDTEDRTHFAMWCMLSAPLMLGNDLNTMRAETLDIITNEALIAIDQDPACLPATVILTRNNTEIWQKDLGKKHSPETAIAFLNRGETEMTVSVSWDELGYATVASVTELWCDLEETVGDGITVTLAPHETAIFRVVGTRTETTGTIYADITVSDATEAVSLTEFGQTDWICLGQMGAYENFRKDSEIHSLATLFSDITEQTESINTFCYWEGDGENIPFGYAGGGNRVFGKGNSFDTIVKLDTEPILLTLVMGIGTSDASVELLSNGRQISTQQISGDTDGTVPEKLLTVYLAATEPGFCTIRVTVAEDSDEPTVTFFGAAISPAMAEKDPVLTDAETARSLLAGGAILLDVRTPEEYAQGHPAGAVNFPVNTILADAATALPDRDTVILTYCTRSKRSLQAYQLLRYLGYTHVYWLGATDPQAE